MHQSIVNGKSVTYEYCSSGLPKTVTAQDGLAISMEYDLQGNRTKLTDQDLGITLNHYTGFGELDWERITNDTIQGQLTTSYAYDNTTGLLSSINRNNENTVYTYDNLKRLKSIEISGKHKQSIMYDNFNLISSVTELIDENQSFTKTIGYDSYGRVKTEIFPDGYFVENHYDIYGNRYKVTDSSNRSIWEATQSNARGQISHEQKGSKETIYSFDQSKGGIITGIFADGVMNYGFSYDAKYNVESRTDYMTDQKEIFTYDHLNRLTNWDVHSACSSALQKSN